LIGLSNKDALNHKKPVSPGPKGVFVWAFWLANRFEFACLIPGHFEVGMMRE
jgi:uncharacterized cupredoxin-like copper-binding protein